MGVSPEALPDLNPSLGSPQGLPLRGAPALCADSSDDSATLGTPGGGAQQYPPPKLLTERLQSHVRTPTGSVGLEGPGLVSVDPSLAEVGFLSPRMQQRPPPPEGGGGGQVGSGFCGRPRTRPLPSLSSCWLWVTCALLGFGGSLRLTRFLACRGFGTLGPRDSATARPPPRPGHRSGKAVVPKNRCSCERDHGRVGGGSPLGWWTLEVRL